MKHRASEEDYAWNPRICACECDKDCEIDKNLKDCECMKSLVDDLAVTSDEIVNAAETTPINPSNGTNY